MRYKKLKIKHCCELMDRFLDEGRVSIGYDDVLREYYIKLHKNRHVIQQMFYCPWCGKKLPHSLRDKWFKLMRTDHGLENPSDDKRKVPLKFRSDKWWKERGL